MKFLKLLLIFAFGITSVMVMAQQRAITSTFPYNGLLINPAYAGSLNVLSVTAVHREQWVNVEGAPKFQSINAHSSFMNNQIGVGFLLAKSSVGVNDDVSLYGSYAYKITTGIGILAMGVSGGFDNRKSDFNQLEILNSTDAYLAKNRSEFNPNFGVGLYFANPTFFMGVSAPYLLENEIFEIKGIDVSEQDSRQSRYYYVTSGFVYHLTSFIKLHPYVLLRIQEENRMGWDISTSVIFEDIAYAGVSVRNSGDITFIGQLILNENFRVGYAYDANTNELSSYSRGSHEVLLNYRIKLRNYRKDPQCPVYF